MKNVEFSSNRRDSLLMVVFVHASACIFAGVIFTFTHGLPYETGSGLHRANLPLVIKGIGPRDPGLIRTSLTVETPLDIKQGILDTSFASAKSSSYLQVSQ